MGSWKVLTASIAMAGFGLFGAQSAVASPSSDPRPPAAPAEEVELRAPADEAERAPVPADELELRAPADEEESK